MPCQELITKIQSYNLKFVSAVFQFNDFILKYY